MVELGGLSGSPLPSMSYHVYIARAGFNEQPIPPDAWLAAVRADGRLAVVERPDSAAGPPPVVTLRATGEWLALTPYGLVQAQDPSAALVAVMFDVAAALDGLVYSERLKPYRSVDDWTRRTAPYRAARDGRRQAARRRRWVSAVLTAVLLVASVGVGWLLGAPHGS